MNRNAHPQSECATHTLDEIDRFSNDGDFYKLFEDFAATAPLVVDAPDRQEDGFASPLMAYHDTPVARWNYDLLLLNTTPACSFLFSALDGSRLAERRDHGALERLTPRFAKGGPSCKLSSQTTDIRHNCDDFELLQTVFNVHSIEYLGEMFSAEGDTLHVLTFPYPVRRFTLKSTIIYQKECYFRVSKF